MQHAMRMTMPRYRLQSRRRRLAWLWTLLPVVVGEHCPLMPERCDWLWRLLAPPPRQRRSTGTADRTGAGGSCYETAVTGTRRGLD